MVKPEKKQLLALIITSSNIAHIILAAGSSSRLGSPKQLLPWKKKTLIEYEIEKSLQLKQVTTFVILGASFEIIKKEIAHFPIEIIYNQDWQSGMGSSISFGIQQILKNKVNFGSVLITLVDQPMIDTIHLNSLISKFNENHNAIIATTIKNRIGVPAIFPSKCFEELLKLKYDYGARHMIKNYKDEIITVDGKDKTDDIDTMQQYKVLFERMKE